MQRYEFLKKYQIIVKMWYKIPTHNNINNNNMVPTQTNKQKNKQQK